MHETSLVIGALVVMTAFGCVSAQLQDLRLLAEWKEAEYEFPDDAERQRSLDAQEYVPGNGVPIDMDIDYGGLDTPRVFVTVPRFNPGVPITLGTLTKNKNAGGPQIRGYPSYSWNSNAGNNCDGLTSVFRVSIDDCRRLWVLDTGKIGDVQSCPPQLVVFDLDNDQVVRQYKFPASQYKIGSSLFIMPVVDVRDQLPGTAYTCPNTMVYAADVNGFGILVYDFQQNRSWRAQNKFMYPSPYAGTFSLAGETFDLMDGVFALALSPRSGGQHQHHNVRQQPSRHAQPHRPHAPARPSGYQSSLLSQRSGAYSAGSSAASASSASSMAHRVNDNDRKLYMHPLASTTEVAVPLRILDNATMWEANVEAAPRSFVEIGNRGGQATAEAMDRNGNLFFGLINPIGVGCWDSQKQYGREAIRVVARNDQTLQFTSGLKIKQNRDGAEEMWVTTCRFQKVMTGSISRDEVNFRIQAVEVSRLLNGQQRCGGGSALPSQSGVVFPRA